MKKIVVAATLLSVALLASQCRKTTATFPEAYYDPRLSGGAATVFDATSQAFGHAVPGMSAYDQYVHDVGDALFEQTFVSAPAPHFPGLGPLYNNVSCISCHHNDGKGTPTLGQPTSSLLTRISIPGLDAHGGPVAAGDFGLQLQDKAISGWLPKVKVQVDYSEQTFTFPDGTTAQLRKPSHTLLQPFKPLPAGYMTSVRLAPPVFGGGLLEMIPENTILALADPDDKDGDGISGKPNYVFNPFTKQKELGRFGLKANNPNLMIQIAGAFVHDMGITNYVFPNENYEPSNTVPQAPPDITDSMLDAMVFYVRTLAVPARRDVENTAALRGERLFNQIQCASCHTPTVKTGVDVRIASLSNQRIHPYTDLLLHDMGEGLSDGRPDYDASAREWKTPALWGIGLFPKTNGTPFYLHDGRARTITEAILWHGGEAENAKQQFVNLPKEDRVALLKFINSL